MTRLELLKGLKRHDWYYDYSDDIGVCRAGRSDKHCLETSMKELGCTFHWWALFAYISNNIIEEMVAYKRGFARPEDIKEWESKGYRVAGVSEHETISRGLYNQINYWFHGSGDEVNWTDERLDDQLYEKLLEDRAYDVETKICVDTGLDQLYED